jgi:hypothetical protein
VNHSVRPSENALVPMPGSGTHRLQQTILLELLAGRQLTTGELDALAAQSSDSPRAARAAAEALVAAGLAEIQHDGFRAAPVARYFDALWPVVI